MVSVESAKRAKMSPSGSPRSSPKTKGKKNSPKMSPAKAASNKPFYKVDIDDVTDKNVEQVRNLNSVIFPVRYNEKFYTELLKRPSELQRLAYLSDIIVGSICTRIEIEKEVKKLYIMTLGVLAPYRGGGIGGQLLNDVLDNQKAKGITEAFLHVQVNNKDAVKFYEKYGFSVGETVANYYKRISPSDAVVLRKTL
eukprot:GFYU01009841.1.p1 GENE.GFYU01009841.1~~GFYU01009841.1.p1  ORF type:complete len:196 (+),score=58.23 GFYU01009841.1:64-651(+)